MNKLFSLRCRTCMDGNIWETLQLRKLKAALVILLTQIQNLHQIFIRVFYVVINLIA